MSRQIILILVFIILVIRPNPIASQIINQSYLTPQSDTTQFLKPNFLSTDAKLEGYGVGSRIMGTPLLNIASNPLIVVNGIPFDNIDSEKFDFNIADERDYARLIGVSQNDIKTISVLTDEPSKGRYGQRASSGVIAIITKCGKTDKINIAYSYKATFATLPNGFDLLNGSQYLALMEEAYFNQGYIPNDPDIFPNPINPSNYYNLSANTNWHEAITQTSVTNDHYIALSGGTSKINYRWSAGYIGQKGTINETEQKQINSRLGLGYHPSTKVEISFDFDLYHNKKQDAYTGYNDLDIIKLATITAPNKSIYRYDENGNLTNDYFYRLYNTQPGTFNPVAIADYNHSNNNIYRYTPSLSFRYSPSNALTYKLNTLCNWHGNEIIDGVPNEIRNNSSEYNHKVTNENRNYSIQNQLTYSPKLGEMHKLSSTLFINTNVDKIKHNDSTTISSGSDILSYEYYVIYPYTTYETNLALEVEYALFNRYFVDVMLRADKTKIEDTKFDNRYYPSTTLKWVISNEEFMKSVTFIDHLSLHGNYGENGVQSMKDKDKIEKTTIVEVGTSMSMFKKRLQFAFNLYSRKLDNRSTLVDIAVPGGSIYNHYWYTEFWHDHNKGWELNLNAAIVKQNNWTLDFAINLNNSATYTAWESNLNYKIISAAIDKPYRFYNPLVKNEKTGNFFGYNHKGVYATSEATAARDAYGQIMTDISGNPIPMTYRNTTIFEEGDAMYSDRNHDGTINDDDTEYIGNANPVFSGSGGPTVRYKNISLGIYFNFRTGNDIVNLARMDLEGMNGNSNQSTETLNRWRNSGDVTNIPRALHYYNNYNTLPSNRFVENGSFLRLKALTLKYEINTNVTQKLHIKSLSCFATCRNLFTWTKYQGADADIWLNQPYYDMGFDSNYRAATKEFTFGINVGI